MALNKDKTLAIIKKFGKDEKDCGCTEVQIALLTARIQDLTAHIKNNGQDAAAHRSLLILVGKRRSLLNYLAKTDVDRYAKLLKELSLRK